MSKSSSSLKNTFIFKLLHLIFLKCNYLRRKELFTLDSFAFTSDKLFETTICFRFSVLLTSRLSKCDRALTFTRRSILLPLKLSRRILESFACISNSCKAVSRIDSSYRLTYKLRSIISKAKISSLMRVSWTQSSSVCKEDFSLMQPFQLFQRI